MDLTPMMLNGRKYIEHTEVLHWIYIEVGLRRIYIELVHWHKLQKPVKSSMVLEARRLAREGGWVGRGHSKRGPLGHWQCFISPSGWYSLCDNLSSCTIKCILSCMLYFSLKVSLKMKDLCLNETYYHTNIFESGLWKIGL